jgi:hypothetical protein
MRATQLAEALAVGALELAFGFIGAAAVVVPASAAAQTAIRSATENARPYE